jgi:hypothetical protein
MSEVLGRRGHDVELKWGDPPKAKVLKRVAGNAIANRQALLQEWEARGDA